MEFLVLPRMLALMLMMPLLCVYADMMGMLAGLLIGTGLLDLSVVEYVNETRKAVHLVDFGWAWARASSLAPWWRWPAVCAACSVAGVPQRWAPRGLPPWSRALSGSSP